MCFVCQQQHAVFVGKLCNTADIRTNAIVGRVVDQNRLGIRIFQNGTFHSLYGHAQRNAQILVFVRIDIDGNGTIDNQRIDGAAVHITGHDELFSRLAD